MRICVIIPTYNEAKAIAEVVRKALEQKVEVVVIDDGSLDNTFELAQDNGAIVLRNENNEGKGASLSRGFRYALDTGADAVITMDGDGQHLPEEIPSFISMASRSNSGIIIGNRMLKKRNMPSLRVITNKFMSWLISLVAGQRIPDTQCGFRLIKRDVLERITLKTSKYESESEILIQASRLGYAIESVPIKTIYNGEKSQINPVTDTLRFAKFMLKEIWTTRN